MDYIHVKNLDKYQPGYTDRRHIWAKIYYETFLDEAVQALCEIDRYRFWSLIVFEVYTQKPVPLTDTNLKIMGWSKSKRRIPLSLQMLHTLVEVRNVESKPVLRRVEESRVDKSRIEESRRTHLRFVKLTDKEYESLVEKFGELKAKEWIEELNGAVGSKGYKYKSHYLTILNWARKDAKDGRGKTRNFPSESKVGETVSADD